MASVSVSPEVEGKVASPGSARAPRSRSRRTPVAEPAEPKTWWERWRYYFLVVPIGLTFHFLIFAAGHTWHRTNQLVMEQNQHIVKLERELRMNGVHVVPFPARHPVRFGEDLADWWNGYGPPAWIAFFQ